jgi:hypothetical protein
MHSRLAFAVAAASLGALALPGPLWSQAPVAAGMQPPAPGSIYSFTCTDQNGKAFNEEYKIVNSDKDSIRVEVQTGARRNTYQKPIYAMATTIVDRETVDGQERTMSGGSSFAALRSLAPGTNVSTYLTERRGGSTRISWNYTVSVLGREVVYHRDFGDLGVVVVNEDRWAELYSSSMQSHFAPQMKFPIYWKYKDSNSAQIECKLASASGVTPVAAAPSAPAPAASAPAAVPARPQAPPPPAAAPASAPPPPQVAARPATATPYPPAPAAVAPTAVAAPPAPVPAATPGGAPDAAKQARLNQLQDLLKQGVISKEEYALKEREIRTESPVSNIAAELTEANRLFRERRVTQDEFVQRRARILAKITPGEMQPKDALVLLNQLLEAQLISPSEHKAKRGVMLSAL